MSNKRQKKKAARLNNCALCGRPLPREQGRRVVGRTGLGVCDKCLRVGLKLTEPPKKSPEWVASGSVLTPQQLVAQGAIKVCCGGGGVRRGNYGLFPQHRCQQHH